MIRHLSIFVLVLVAAVVLTGCNGEQIAQFRAQLQTSQAGLAQFQKALDAAVASQVETAQEIAIAPPGPAREKAVAQYNQTNEVIKISRSAVGGTANLFGELARELETVTDGPGMLDASTKTIAPYFGGYEPLVLMGGGLIVALWRAYRSRRGARNLARSVNDEIKKLTPEQLTAIAARQTPEAKRIVDEAQGKKWSLPI